jgi:hypothetical protein
LTGYQVRGEQQDRVAEWREYQLSPADYLPGDLPVNFPLQLAEYQGHWLLISLARHHPEIKGARPFVANRWEDETNNRKYKLWHRYRPVIRDAQGEFDWNILNDERLKIQEFMAPPYQLSSEQEPGEAPVWYVAEYVEPEYVAAAFGLSVVDLPERFGIGSAQLPPSPNWPRLLHLAVWAGLALLALQLVLLAVRGPEQVLNQSFALPEPVAVAGSSQTMQMLTSQSFTLARTTALEINLNVPHLNNHWAEVTASLVNEQTGRGYEFTRSIEYYQGYEGGEHWTEGGTDAQATLSHVPAGRYHLNLYPTLDAGAGSDNLVAVVETSTPLWSNFWLALLAVLALPILVGWRQYNFESSRWQQSEFNPYPTDDSSE